MALIIRPMNSLGFSYVAWNRPKSLLLGAAASQVLRLETKGGVIEELSVKRVFNIQCTPVKPLTYLSWMIYCRRVFHLCELVEMSSFRMRIKLYMHLTYIFIELLFSWHILQTFSKLSKSSPMKYGIFIFQNIIFLKLLYRWIKCMDIQFNIFLVFLFYGGS